MHIPGLLNDHIALQLPEGAILDDVAVLYTFVDADGSIKVACAPSEGTDTVESLQLAVNFVLNLQDAGYLTEANFQIDEVPTHDPFPGLPEAPPHGPLPPNGELPPDRYPLNPEITE